MIDQPIKHRYKSVNNFHPVSMTFKEQNDGKAKEVSYVEEGLTYIVDMNGNMVKRIGSDSDSDSN